MKSKTPPPKPGDLSERLTLMKRQIKEDDSGDVQQIWETTERLWAKITPLFFTDRSGQEGWNEEKKINLKFQVTIRFCLYNFQRIQWLKGVYRLITPPQIDEKKRWLTFIVEQIDGEKQ